MTNYSQDEGMVRVEFFRLSGKWYMTEAWNMNDFYNHKITPSDAVRAMLFSSSRGQELMRQFIVVVLDPYHKLAYPVLLMPTNEGLAS